MFYSLATKQDFVLGGGGLNLTIHKKSKPLFLFKQTACDILWNVIEIQRGCGEFEVGSTKSILKNNVRWNSFVGGLLLLASTWLPGPAGRRRGWHAVGGGMSSPAGEGLQCTERSFLPPARLKNGLTGRRNSILVSSWPLSWWRSDDEKELQRSNDTF